MAIDPFEAALVGLPPIPEGFGYQWRDLSNPLLDKAGGEGWRFGTFGLRCKACARENYRAYREAKQAGLRAIS